MPPQILIADADPGVNTLVVVILSRAGFPDRHLPDPSAVAAAMAPGVGLVVVGGSTASAAAVDLRARGGRTPVLILAAVTCPVAASLAASDPSVRILRKPFLLPDLVRAVAEMTTPG